MHKITIYEVSPRDGLQFEAKTLPPETIAEFIDLLTNAGILAIEVGAFVSARKIPQMAHTDKVLSHLHKKAGVRYITLVPNQQGMEMALQHSVQEIAVFTGASDAFLQKNIGCTLEESFLRFKPVMELAQKHGVLVRGYISTAFGCPFTGKVPKTKVADIAHRLYVSGCHEVSLADTTAEGKPDDIPKVLEAVTQGIPIKHLAVHFHDSLKRLALANVLAAVHSGISTIDSAVGNLGGCPYAPGASGNIATETVIETLGQAGFETGISLPNLLHAKDYIFNALR